MEYFPSAELVQECLGEFRKNPPLYRYEEAEDDYYTVYTMEDAAVDALTSAGITALSDPAFRYSVEALADSARKEVEDYDLIMKMRFTLQNKFNRHVSIETVDQQG